MANMQKRSVKDIDVTGKRVIVRVDFNVPLDKKSGEITDDKRIRGALPTIQYLVEQGARVILVSHLGRPKGVDATFSLKPAADRLSELLGKPVALAADVIGEDAKAKAEALKDGEVLILENVRFHKEETKNDTAFARELASMADIYVNDAFGTAHRAHASTAGLANFLPAVSGMLIQREVDIMGRALSDPKRPFVAILGGAKVSDKIGVIENLLAKVDTLIIGGGMSYTFLVAQGQAVGASLVEEDKVDLAKQLLEDAEKAGVKLLLPVDHVVADRFAADADHRVVDAVAIEDGWMGLDIGPKTVELFGKAIREAGTIVWNGPMGVFEFDAFANGTREVARAVAEADAVSIIGGGDSAAAVELLGFADQVTHISTGGGASLEFLEGKVLPGIDCLLDTDARALFSAGNWKMNLGTPAEAAAFINDLKPLVADAAGPIVVAVPATALAAAVEAAAFSNIHVAAQNCHFEAKGAYTGEISPVWLAKMGVGYCVIGHSERREYFAETDETVNRKLLALLEQGVRPIVCCGESLSQRESGDTFDFVKSQIVAAFENVPAERLGHVTVAYEPIWAIGTGVTASDEQAEEVCAFIRGVMADLYSVEAADEMRILYGGSVNAANVAGLYGQTDIDGGLVGGASLKLDDFAAICNTWSSEDEAADES